MKRIYDWITKTNQVLLFLVIIGGAALVGYTIYQTTRRFEPPHVSVAQTAEEAKGSVVEDVGFLGQSSGLLSRLRSSGLQFYVAASLRASFQVADLMSR